ncbi:MAG: shikimate dehydrogenase [Saprospiraceae bacterium]
MKKLGLIGYPLSHSFSVGYFGKKFEAEGITDFQYDNYAIPTITEFPKLLKNDIELFGLNVTIPYKEQVIPYLDELDEAAAAIGAVNTIQIKNGKTKGFNTDVYGFKFALLNLLDKSYASANINQIEALVLGTGGAAKAVYYVLNELNIPFKTVSRSAKKGDLTYTKIDQQVIEKHRLIVNTTPLGMSPNISSAPDLPYEYLTAQHFLYDLIYNPPETRFLKQGKKVGAAIANGLQMLHLQAEKSWEIWNNA